MAEVRGFTGVRYRLERAEDAGAVIAPPYDVISPADAEALRARHTHNVIRLELPEDHPTDSDADNRYTRAAALYRMWLGEGVLQREIGPAVYVYGQRYETPEGPRERLGILAALRVEPYEAGVVLPHEQTFPKDKEDRYRMLKTAQAQYSPIFGLYAAPEARVRQRLLEVVEQPAAEVAVDPEGVTHRLWSVSDPAFLAWVEGTFSGRQVFIADGHHRYDTALRYRNERHAQDPDTSGAPSDYVMSFLVEMDDSGLVLLPTHRLVKAPLPPPEEIRRRLEPYFRFEDVSLEAAGQLEHHQLGIVLPDSRAWRLTLNDASILERFDRDHSAAWRDLDVAILHRLVFEEALGLEHEHGIVYTRSPREARERVLSGEFAASFLQPAPRVEELKAVAGAGDKMPHKSTYFWPKAITGLVIYPLD